MNKIVVGQPVPNFEFEATSGLSGSLADYKGQAVILYFYPKDDTPGCTTESCNFNTDFNAFKQLNAAIFGISRDNLVSHEKFKAKFGLQFELIADTDSTLCHLFDVIKDKNMYGKLLKGIQRSTFIIDGAGILRYEWRGVKVPGHIKEVLESIELLS